VRTWTAVCVALAALAVPTRAHAHVAGAASIDRYLDFVYVGDGRFRVAYVLDFAEGPARAELDRLDANHDGAVTPEEQRRYLDARVAPLVDAWAVTVDGVRVHPSVVASHVEVVHADGGTETVRIDSEVSVVATPPWAGADLTLHVHDDSFARIPGWRLIQAEDGVAETDGAVPTSVRAEVAGDADALRMSDARFVIHARSRADERAGRLLAVGLLFAAAALLAVLFVARRARQSA